MPLPRLHPVKNDCRNLVPLPAKKLGIVCRTCLGPTRRMDQAGGGDVTGTPSCDQYASRDGDLSPCNLLTRPLPSRPSPDCYISGLNRSMLFLTKAEMRLHGVLGAPVHPPVCGGVGHDARNASIAARSQHRLCLSPVELSRAMDA